MHNQWYGVNGDDATACDAVKLLMSNDMWQQMVFASEDDTDYDTDDNDIAVKRQAI